MDCGPLTITMRLCHVTDIAEGEAKGFLPSPSAKRKVIVLQRNGVLHGWLDSCPHYAGGTPMAWRSNAYMSGDGQHIACHSHGALFDMETGECILGPCLGQSLSRVDLHVTDTGDVFVTE
jgi:nitrite reductase/ring-hydroxylating ferredoxin subunit